MGRVKSRFVKSSGEKIFKNGKSEFSSDFTKNKEVVDKYANIPSKKLRNAIVGYITRLSKRNSEDI